MAKPNKKPASALPSPAIFSGVPSGIEKIHIEERDLAAEIFEQKSVKEVIDKFEEAKGILPHKDLKVKPSKKKSVILDLDNKNDKALLEKLMNDPKYSIIKWSESWTAIGRFRVFVIYSDTEEQTNKESQ